MPTDLDQRTYDLLQLIERHEPIGSIRLVELMRRRGYSIGGRSVRFLLTELDDRGLTEKVEWKGRRITARGQCALRQGNVTSRLAWVRARIATLASQVTFDPIEDSGTVVASAATVDTTDLGAALSVLDTLATHPLGPCPVSVTPTASSAGGKRLLFPSSITLDGVLLSRGIDADLQSAGIVEYEPSDTRSNPERDQGGRITRAIDVISGEDSTVDVVTLLIEAGRTRTLPTLEHRDNGRLVVDYRRFPFTRYDEARDLAGATRDALGGVMAVRRPREDSPFPLESTGREFGSLVYGGCGEIAISVLAERGLTDEWETLFGIVDRAEFESVSTVRRKHVDG